MEEPRHHSALEASRDQGVRQICLKPRPALFGSVLRRQDEQMNNLTGYGAFTPITVRAHTEQTKQEAVKAFLAKGGKITKCPTVHANSFWEQYRVHSTGIGKHRNWGKK